jgi:hypothetical protein
MFPMRQLIFLFFIFSCVFSMSAQQALDTKPDPPTAKARILQQKYCRADADLFTVSLRIEIEVTNSSKTSLYLLWPMVPWVGKVASGVGDAESGHFLYEQTASHYLQEPVRFDRLKIEPGKKVTVESGYDLVARHDPAFSLPKSISAGTYGLVLVLRPEEKPPSQMTGPETIETITTDPFLLDVPTDPKLVDCESGAKAR